MRRRNAATCRDLSALVLRPCTSTLPRVGRSSSAMSLSTVLLPAPERPVRNTISPLWTLKLTLVRASRPLGYRLLTRSKVIMRCRALDQRRGKGGGVEFAEVLGRLADADEADRDRK